MDIVKKNILKRPHEKGIALLFTLGILTVLLVLALGFATTSITQRRGAATNVQGTVARLLAESALERVVGTLQIYDESVFACSHCDSNTHPSSPTENRGTSDWIHRLETMDPGTAPSGVFQWNNAYTAINWEYVTVNDGINDIIIGRVAYVIIPGGGIDPGVLVKNGVNEASNAEIRLGVDVNEINLQSIDSSITSSIANKMNRIPTSSGMYNGNWVSFTKLFKDVGITNSNTKNNFRKWFVIDANEDAEAYWVDDNGDNNIDIDIANNSKNELYHRFNLARADWDTLTVNQILAAPVAADEYNSADGTYKGGGLRWLANFGKDSAGADNQNLKGTFPTVASRRNQIAANLIDYCDSDSEPTKDSDSNPTYTGNEITPYINEIGIKVEFTAKIKRSGPPGNRKYTNSYTFSIIPTVEITNGFKGLDTVPNLNQGDTTFKILEGTLFYTRQQSDGTFVPGTISLAASTAPNFPSTYEVQRYDYRTRSLTAISGPSITGNTIGSTTDTSPATITNVYVQIKRARLMYNGNFADFVKPDYDGGFSEVIPTLVTLNNTGVFNAMLTRSCCFSYQANDPRQNLNDDDWLQATASSPGADTTVANSAVYGNVSYGGNTVGTPADPVGNPSGSNIGTNEKLTFTTEGDMEPSNLSPTTLSTSYIRNAPMVSPWELGAIQRGAAWETINLKEYNKAAAVNPLSGGGLYTDTTADANPDNDNGGDANILDQIKMNDDVESDQKVSLKLQTDTTTGVGVLNALFKKIKVGSSYANPGTGVSELTPVGVAAIVNDIKSRSLTFLTRANVTQPNVGQPNVLINGTGGVTQTTDRQKEEIIGKMINLTSIAQSDYFTIIVLAQSIKDVGTGTFYKDLDMDGICTPTSTASEVTLDADINGDGDMVDTGIPEKIVSAGFGKYTQYADEIVAEQKIRADVYRDPISKKCTIIKMEYVEE
jgi:hypothetical protein